VYEVQTIKDVRTKRGGTKEYLVKWMEGDETWELEENLTCPKLLQAFHKQRDGGSQSKKKKKNVNTG
jgi:hypothetical protein